MTSVWNTPENTPEDKGPIQHWDDISNISDEYGIAPYISISSELEERNRIIVETNTMRTQYEVRIALLSREVDHYKNQLSIVRDNFSKSMVLETNTTDDPPYRPNTSRMEMSELYTTPTTRQSPRNLNSEFRRVLSEERLHASHSLCGNE